MSAAVIVDEAPAPIAPTKRARNPYIRGLRTPRGIAGLTVVALVVLLGLAAPLLTRYAPTFQTADALLGPSGEHPLGTDEIGRDLWSRVLFGIRTDLIVVVSAVPLGALTGCLLALVSVTSRWADVVVQRAFDLVLAFPGLILGLTVTAVLGAGKSTVIVVIAVVEAPAFGRMLRGAILSHREREYALAARVGGAGRVRLLVRHILPNAADPLVVQIAVSLSIAVIVEGAMSFIGIGVRPPEPSLGSIVSGSVMHLQDHPSYAIGPLVAISAFVLGLNLIAEALNKGVRR
ncbi:ABC transporter permease [Embleya sp. NPDC020886]|uniref:ABC transporter permease n=1 Tax=Embleya sp. NPDC020886 TaxID=3363980 RepID=UPI0037A8A78E